jgi:tRNA pseudouridine13 synthase
MLDGTHSVFVCDLCDSELVNRCREGDIHPTGPLPGDGGLLPQRDAVALETAVLEPYHNLVEALGKARLEGDRRSLRLRVSELKWELSGACLSLSFILPPGAYATTVIDELVSPLA